MLPEQAYNSSKGNRCPRPCCYLFVPIKLIFLYFEIFTNLLLKVVKNNNAIQLLESGLTLFLPGEGGISPLIVYHVTKSVRNRVNIICKIIIVEFF